MPNSFTGGCVCGAIRYECTSRPIAMLNCHCRDCQQVTGDPVHAGRVCAGQGLSHHAGLAPLLLHAERRQRTKQARLLPGLRLD